MPRRGVPVFNLKSAITNLQFLPLFRGDLVKSGSGLEPFDLQVRQGMVHREFIRAAVGVF